MKRLLFAAYSLGLGGIGTALIALLDELAKKDYEITLVLERKEGIFLDMLNPKIKVIEYTPSNNKIVPLRKLINLCKQLKFKLKYNNKFDFAAAYATYSLSNGFIARTAAKNSALWIHSDYFTINKQDVKKTIAYYKEIKCEEFNKIIFVSNKAKENFTKLFPQCKEKVELCNNVIDGKRIIEKSEEQILEQKEHITTFLNVGRHMEQSKKLTRLIEVAEMLKKDGLEFKILFVGDGPDNSLYREMVKSKKIEDKIIFLGQKKNPYPYFKISDCVVLTSDYEGYPVVFNESRILKKPIITTDVSDYEQIEGRHGIVTTKSIQDIYTAMKNFIQRGFEIKDEFDYKKYNEEILTILEKLF